MIRLLIQHLYKEPQNVRDELLIHEDGSILAQKLDINNRWNKYSFSGDRVIGYVLRRNPETSVMNVDPFSFSLIPQKDYSPLVLSPSGPTLWYSKILSIEHDFNISKLEISS